MEHKIDRGIVKVFVREKIRSKEGAFDFISTEYLDLLVDIIVESLQEACTDCDITNKEGV